MWVLVICILGVISVLKAKNFTTVLLVLKHMQGSVLFVIIVDLSVWVSLSVTTRDRGIILGIYIHLGKTNRKQ